LPRRLSRGRPRRIRRAGRDCRQRNRHGKRPRAA
jgi:hypothetical protein